MTGLYDPSGRALTPEDFLEALRDTFGGKGMYRYTLGSRLREDLAFDSLALFEIVTFLDEACGRPLTTDEVESLKTVEDVYICYLQRG